MEETAPDAYSLLYLVIPAVSEEGDLAHTRHLKRIVVRSKRELPSVTHTYLSAMTSMEKVKHRESARAKASQIERTEGERESGHTLTFEKVPFQECVVG